MCNQESTPSLYGCAAKLKDNAQDCKPKASSQDHKHHVKQMVLINLSLFNVLLAVNKSSAIINVKNYFWTLPYATSHPKSIQPAL
jgi:hypothetical protein